MTICAMMQIENVFTTPANEKIAADRAKRKFSVTEGDHLTMYNVYKAFIQVRLVTVYKPNPYWILLWGSPCEEPVTLMRHPGVNGRVH